MATTIKTPPLTATTIHNRVACMRLAATDSTSITTTEQRLADIDTYYQQAQQALTTYYEWCKARAAIPRDDTTS